MSPDLPAPVAQDDDAITVNEAARLLGCHHSTVRELLLRGELQGHRVGKSRQPGGVRVNRGSCLDYIERHAIAGSPAEANGPVRPPRHRLRPPRSNPAHMEALAALRARGLRV